MNGKMIYGRQRWCGEITWASPTHIHTEAAYAWTPEEAIDEALTNYAVRRLREL